MARDRLPFSEEDEHMLRIVLAVIGVVFIVGVCPLSLIWPSGWRWGAEHSTTS